MHSTSLTSSPAPWASESASSPKMPAAFQLLNRKQPKSIPSDRPIHHLEPLPLSHSRPKRPLHRRVSSRSCENFGIAFSSPAEARRLQQTHVREASRDQDLEEVLDLYHEREDDSSGAEDLQLDKRLSLLAKSPDRYGQQSRVSQAESNTTQDTDTPEVAERSIPANNPLPIEQLTGDEPRDQYGFRCATQHTTLEDYNSWWTSYASAQERRRKKWDSLIAESGLSPSSDGLPIHFPSRSTKVQRYVRKGIPPEYRGRAWFFYANGPRILKKNPGLYQRLVQLERPDDDTNVELIERDLHRTFPDNSQYKPFGYVKPMQTTTNSGNEREPILIGSLRRVLQAYASHRPQVGYCQSLNFLAGLFLLFLDEEKSFWMLVIITTDYLPHVHDANLEGANIDQAVLMLSIKESLPAIWTKMMGNMEGGQSTTQHPPSIAEIVTKLPPITLVTAAWFMSAYTGVLPIETTLRVWDCFFYEGSKILFRIALTILKLGETKILATKDFIEIFQIVQSLPRDMLDPGTLMEACFKRRNGIGHLSQKDVEQRREKVSKIRQKDMKHRQSRDDIRVTNTRQGFSRSVFRR